MIDTPNIDRLAASGLRYNRFHVTSICSSTRAAVLSGRNHHAVGVGMTMETPLGFPGYTGRLPASAALLPRVLRDGGYSTLAIGKWHLCPRGEYSQSGPMTRWPLGVGFDRYYGFLGAETNQWAPELCRDNTLVDAPRLPVEGYHLTEDLVDLAIRMILDQSQATPSKPWFCYFATGAAHAPHQVPGEWSNAYRGRFDSGWENLRSEIFQKQVQGGIVPGNTVLSGRPSWIQPWEDLSGDERRLFARYMEVFAGFVTHTDAHLGRLFDFLEQRGDLDRTLVLLLSDNGASAEGSPTGTLNEPSAWLGQPESIEEAVARVDDIGTTRAFNHYPFGWAWAGNTPLQLWKRYAWLGGVRTPLVVRLPALVKDPGAVRSQFCHAVDLFPTVLDIIGIDAPAEVDGVAQQRVDGASMASSFAEAASDSPRDTQYFEMHGSRGLYHAGWKVTTDYVSPMFGERARIPGSDDFDSDRWLLFNLAEDFAEAVDVSDRFPDKVIELERLWWSEAGRNQVLPLFEGPASLTALHPSEFPPPVEASYVPGTAPVYEGVMPPLFGGFTATAEIASTPETPASGIVCALGDLNEGWAFYLLDGRPCTCLVTSGYVTRVASDSAIPPGECAVSVEFRPASPAIPSRPSADNLQILVDGKVVAGGVHPGAVVFVAHSTAGGGLLVGRDRGLAVCDDYEPPFPFSATLRRVVIRSGAPSVRRDPADVVRTATASD